MDVIWPHATLAQVRWNLRPEVMGNSLLRSELKPEFEPDSKASSGKTFLTLDKLKYLTLSIEAIGLL